MPHENLIYAVNAHQLSNNEQEDIIILIYAASAEIAKNHITVYQQQNQIRLQYSFLPLPLNTYFQRHADETLIAQLKTTAQELSEQHPVIIFNPNQYRENEKSTTACLTVAVREFWETQPLKVRIRKNPSFPILSEF